MVIICKSPLISASVLPPKTPNDVDVLENISSLRLCSLFVSLVPGSLVSESLDLLDDVDSGSSDQHNHSRHRVCLWHQQHIYVHFLYFSCTFPVHFLYIFQVSMFISFLLLTWIKLQFCYKYLQPWIQTTVDVYM